MCVGGGGGACGVCVWGGGGGARVILVGVCVRAILCTCLCGLVCVRGHMGLHKSDPVHGPLYETDPSRTTR